MEIEGDMSGSIALHFLTRYQPKFLKTPLLMKLFRESIQELEENYQGFGESLRQASLSAIASDDPDLIRRGLQCLVWVGQPVDLSLLTPLLNRREPFVVRDAKTCIFEVKRRGR
jgi:hypothetical protein